MERIIIRSRIWVHYLGSTAHILTFISAVLLYFLLKDYFLLSKVGQPEIPALTITLPFAALTMYLLRKLSQLRAENDQFVQEMKALKARVRKAQRAYYLLG